MGKLIDAGAFSKVLMDYFKNILLEKKTSIADVVDLNADLQRLLEEQPAAYDVEKIVAQIGAIKYGGDCRRDCEYYDWSVGACGERCEEYMRKKAVDIVRNGGKE